MSIPDSRPAILCVDDERIVLDSLKGQLRRALGGEVRLELAEGADEALEVLDELLLAGHPVPVVLSDQIMPGTPGHQLLAAVHRRSPGTRTVLLTGQATLEAVGSAVNNASLFRFLAKPWDEAELLFTVRQALDQHRLERTVADKEVEARVAREASAAKGVFLASVSHELRTPLSAVIGMSELLGRTELNERQRRYVDVVSTCGRSLLGLIDDILDLSKIEAGRLELNPTDFRPGALVEDVVSMLAPLGADKGLAVSCQLEATLPEGVRGDAHRLRQVLVNLVGNAVKFTDRGRVEVRAWSEGAPWLHFEVRDSGAGIALEQQARIFEPFVQAEAGHRRGGTGLGTTIARELVRAMGGEIGVRSTLGSGSCFWFTAPLPETEAPPVSAVAVGAVQAPGAHVLLVEDNPINRELATDMLVELGCTVISAPNGAVALERLAEEAVDVVLMDCEMPVMDGFTATRHLRERHGPSPPVLALTAHALAEVRERAFGAGMQDFLTKPLTLSELHAALVRWVPRPLDAERPPAGAGPPPAAPGALGSEQRQHTRLLELLVAHLPTLAAELQQAGSDGDTAGLAAAAHRLKGGAAMGRLPALVERAVALEARALAGVVDEAVLGEILGLVAEVVAEARAVLEG